MAKARGFIYNEVLTLNTHVHTRRMTRTYMRPIYTYVQVHKHTQIHTQSQTRVPIGKRNINRLQIMLNNRLWYALHTK